MHNFRPNRSRQTYSNRKEINWIHTTSTTHLHTFGFKTKVTLELEFPESPFLLGNNEEKLRSFNRFGDFFRCSSNEAKLLGLPLDLGSNNEAKLRSGLFCWAPSIDAKFRWFFVVVDFCRWTMLPEPDRDSMAVFSMSSSEDSSVEKSSVTKESKSPVGISVDSIFVNYTSVLLIIFFTGNTKLDKSRSVTLSHSFAD